MSFSQISVAFDELNELLSVDGATTVPVDLVVTIVEVLLIPCVELLSLSHDIHNEIAQLLFFNHWLTLSIYLFTVGVVFAENGLLELIYFTLNLAVLSHI